MTNLRKLCVELECDIKENEPMARYTSFKIGGPAALMISAPSSAAIQQVWNRCRETDTEAFILGNGSNLLVSDQGVRCVVLRMSGTDGIRTDDGIVVCGAGAQLKQLCLFARNNGLSGLEFAYGIPGSVGGAVYMNAGAYGGEISDSLEWVEAVYPDGALQRVNANELKFGYRHSSFMDENAVITSAAFKLKSADSAHIAGVMDGVMHLRRIKQPLEFPSAGSFFKRPPGHYAGALIEQSGLRGLTVGGAQVSEKHAGFIINRRGATCDDVRRLADEVMRRVLADHGVQLEPEVKYI